MSEQGPVSPSGPNLPASNVADSDDRTQRTARRDFIDTRIGQLEEEIRKWKSERNELSEIARLPPEVLSRVFIHYQRLCTSSSAPTLFYSAIKPFSWTKVAHVSRYWRNTALGCPALWSNVEATTNVRRAQVMFERSKQAPISLTFSTQSADRPELVTIIKDACSQPRRLKGLKILGYNDFVRQRLEELMSPAPNLQSLELRCDMIMVGDGTPSIPDGLLGGEAPMLRTLHLNGYKFTWPALSVFSGLTVLNLSAFSREPGDFPDPEPFFQGLEALPNLRELELDIPLPIVPLATVRVVRLPQLEFLGLRGCLRECDNVLKHLAVSSSLSATLEISRHPQDTAANATAFGQSVSHVLGRVLRSLTLDSNLYGSTIRGHATGMEEDNDWYSAEPILTIHLDTNGFLPELLTALPLNDLLALDLNIGCNHKILAPLSRLPSVRTVYADRVASEDFILYASKDPAFAPTRSRKGTSKKKKAAAKPKKLKRFASVRRLVLEAADFQSIDIECFLDWLMMRYEMGGEIEEVELAACVRLYWDDVQRIEEVVVDVDWDGDVNDCYSEEEDEDDDDDDVLYAGCGLPGCITCFGL
ncbi:hypothetical protein CC2G_009887 [Coprinopsis cinerea AmutBmut pab1-1]|nr:hypothetical protein CC2G_009887 [Coprinopsis cinerea AmutBmut pab1-1]